METVKPTIFYTVDEEGTILDIGGDWQAFVDKGGLEDPQAMADYNMVGKNLFDFIANETVRDMYRELHRKAMDGQKCEFEYRCDGPDVAKSCKVGAQGRRIRYLLHALPYLMRCRTTQKVRFQ